MNIKAIIPAVLLLLGCASNQHPTSIPQRPAMAKALPLLNCPNRSIEEWSPENAIKEADLDIASGSLRIYARGTMVAVAVGLSIPEQQMTIHLQFINLSMPTESPDERLTQAQDAYATVYNKRIVSYLRSK